MFGKRSVVQSPVELRHVPLFCVAVKLFMPSKSQSKNSERRTEVGEDREHRRLQKKWREEERNDEGGKGVVEHSSENRRIG